MEKINIDDLPVDNMADYLIKIAFKIKDSLFQQVMSEVLKREANLDDCKNFQIVTHVHHPGREFIGYMGNMIGEVKYYERFEQSTMSHVCGFRFIPCTQII